jgi:hypothetical protein
MNWLGQNRRGKGGALIAGLEAPRHRESAFFATMLRRIETPVRRSNLPKHCLK